MLQLAELPPSAWSTESSDDNEQVHGANEPVPFESTDEKLTEPPGAVESRSGLISDTDAEHVVEVSTAKMLGEQLTETEVSCFCEAVWCLTAALGAASAAAGTTSTRRISAKTGVTVLTSFM